VRVEEIFVVEGAPEVVFDYVTNPANLSSLQTSNRSVEQLTDGTPGLGSRLGERTKPPLGKEFEQVTEFTEFDRPRRVHVHIVEGPYPAAPTRTRAARRDRSTPVETCFPLTSPEDLLSPGQQILARTPPSNPAWLKRGRLEIDVETAIEA
jgi:hypothetical protein